MGEIEMKTKTKKVTKTNMKEKMERKIMITVRLHDEHPRALLLFLRSLSSSPRSLPA